MIFFIKFYCVFTLSLVIFWATGWGIKKLLKILENISYSSILYNILTGLIAFATVVAVFYTRGKTVMILSILFGVVLYLTHKKEKNADTVKLSSHKEIKYILLNLFLGCSMIFTLLFFTYTRGNFIAFLNSDYCFYADLSYQMIYTGIEHYYTNYVMPPSGLQPYHYLEIWLNGGIAVLTHQNHLSVLLLVTYPIFIFLVYLGVCTLLDYISFKPIFIPLVAFVATFITGIFIPDLPMYAYLEKKFYVDLYTYILWDYHKLSIPYTFIITTLVLFIEKKIKLAYIVLLYTPIFYSTIAIAVFCGTGLLAVYLFLSKKEYGKWLIGHLLLVFAVLFLFYAIFQDKNIRISTQSIVLDVKTKINIIGNTVLGVFFIYWYVPIIAFAFLRKEILFILKTLPYAWLIISIPAFALLGWTILSRNLDSVQIFSNAAMPILNISIIGLFFMLLKFRRKKVFFTLFIIIVGSGIYKTFRNMSEKVVQKVDLNKLKLIQQTFENKPEKLGVFLRDTAEFKYSFKYSLFRINSYSSSMTYYFSCVFSDGYAVLLNVHEANPNAFSELHKQEIARKMIKISIFNRYIEKQKKENRLVSITQSQLDFIKEYKVSYVATRPNCVLPQHLQSLVKERVDLGDIVLHLL